MAIDTTDPLSARLVAATGMLINVLECFDDLGIEPKGAAKKQAEGILKVFGPAAVFCSILQASEAARSSQVASDLVDRYVTGAIARRQDLLDELPIAQRRATEKQERERQAGPDRVLELFTKALAGMTNQDVIARWGSGGGLATMSEQVGRAMRGEEVDTEALEALAAQKSAEENLLPEHDGPLPTEALEVIGGVLAGIGVHDAMLSRVMAGALPVAPPEGYSSDPTGTVTRDQPKVGRNDPCPCGSGRKSKKCHGRGGA